MEQHLAPRASQASEEFLAAWRLPRSRQWLSRLNEPLALEHGGASPYLLPCERVHQCRWHGSKATQVSGCASIYAEEVGALKSPVFLRGHLKWAIQNSNL